MCIRMVRHVWFTLMVLPLVGLALGCTTTLVPGSPAAITRLETDDEQGWLLGYVHLAHQEAERSAGRRGTIGMKWWLEKEAYGTRLQIAGLPIDGPFAVKLPAGSYCVTRIGFDSTRGIWHTELPTVSHPSMQEGTAVKPWGSTQSRECTSLGTWALQMQTGVFKGWITREVAHDHGRTQDESGRRLEIRQYPTLITPLDLSVRNSIELHTPVRVF